MAYTPANRVKETTSTTGTGALTIDGAVIRYRAFSNGHAIGDSGIPYVCEHSTLNEWEIGTGTLVDATHFSRDTILDSSNNKLPVSFSAGTKYLYETVPASTVAVFATPAAPSTAAVASTATSTLMIAEGGVPKRISFSDMLASVGVSMAQLPAATTLADANYISVMQDGVNEAKVTLSALKTYVGSTAPADTVAPSTPGSPTSSNVGQTSVTLNWVASTDNVGVTAYEVSKDGTTWTNAGNVTSYTFTGLTASTTYTLQVRALDAAGNKSAAATLSATTSAATDTIAPTMSGSITTSSVTSSGFTMAYSAGSDNVGVSRYEVSIDGGTTWVVNGTSLTYAASGLAASTAYNLRARCFDAAGNVSNVLTGTVTTSAAAAAETLTVATPSAQYTGTAFTVSGTYANGTPTALDYSLDGGTTWVAAATPTISGGNYSFSITINTANASQTVEVRDHNVTTASAASGAFTVTAATAYTITGYSGNALRTPINASAAGGYGSLKLINPGSGANDQFTTSTYWNVNTTSGGVQAPSATSGWSQSNTTPPADCTSAANANGASSVNGMVSMGKSGAFISNSNLWVTVGSGSTTWYFWIKPSDGAPFCVGSVNVTGA